MDLGHRTGLDHHVLAKPALSRVSSPEDQDCLDATDGFTSQII